MYLIKSLLQKVPKEEHRNFLKDMEFWGFIEADLLKVKKPSDFVKVEKYFNLLPPERSTKCEILFKEVLKQYMITSINTPFDQINMQNVLRDTSFVLRNVIENSQKIKNNLPVKSNLRKDDDEFLYKHANGLFKKANTLADVEKAVVISSFINDDKMALYIQNIGESIFATYLAHRAKGIECEIQAITKSVYHHTDAILKAAKPIPKGVSPRIPHMHFNRSRG